MSDKYTVEREQAERNVIASIDRLQEITCSAAAIIPYSGGVIAFGKREDVMGMLERDKGDGDGGG